MICVSTIIPVYNGEATIARAIDSALAQEFDSFEVIVVDDGSSDGTARILQEYGSRITVVTQSNRGPAAARNAGAAIARGEYLAFLDSDDEWLAQKLSRTIEALRLNQGAVLAHSAFYLVDPEGGRLKHPGTSPVPVQLPIGSYIEDWLILTPSAAVIRRNAFERSGGFCEEFKTPGGEDPYLWLLVRELGPFVHIPEPLVVYYAPDPVAAAAKYVSGHRLFSRLLRQRYGSRARALIRANNRYQASYLLLSASRRLDRNDLQGAVLDLCRSMLLSPAHCLSGPVIRRLVSPTSVKRALRSIRHSRLAC